MELTNKEKQLLIFSLKDSINEYDKNIVKLQEQLGYYESELKDYTCNKEIITNELKLMWDLYNDYNNLLDKVLKVKEQN